MARYDNDPSKYGEPITYDRSFKGPLEDRSCTDVVCLLIFGVFLGAWGFISYYAIANGDLNKLLVPTDSLNRKCGIDSQVIDKPYLFFFNLEKCIDPLVPISGCPTPQVCVKECPKELFVLSKFNGGIEELKEKLICQYESEKSQIRTKQDAQALVDANRCAGWYAKSTPFLNRCMWEFSSQICEYIPLSVISRYKRDASSFLSLSSSINSTDAALYNSVNNVIGNDHHNHHQHELKNILNSENENVRIRRDLLEDNPALSEIPQTSAVTLDKLYAGRSSPVEEILPSYQLQQSSNQRIPTAKNVVEPKIECKIRQQLGEEVIKTKMKRFDTFLSKFVGNFVAHFYNGTEAEQFTQELVEDIITSWPTILVVLIIAMFISLFFIAIMRWVAGPLLWFSIIGVFVALGYGIYFSVSQYIYYRDHPRVPHHSPNLGSTVKNVVEDYNMWLYLTIALSIIFVIILLVVICLRDRIVVAIALVKEGSKAVSSIISTVFFPILPWFLEVIIIAYAIAIGLYLASVGDSAFKVVGQLSSDKCLCEGEAKHYIPGGSCVPEVFNKNCFAPGTTNTFFTSGRNPCSEAACQFDKIHNPSIVGYFHAYNVIGFLWLAFFISAFGDMVLAATFATWYWTFHKSDVPYFTLTRAFFRTIRYHLGTLVLGSLIITICRLIRLILEYIDSKLKKFDNPVTRAILCCLKCFFWCLENFLRFINKNAYIMCAIHGKNFCSSAKDAFNLLMRNCLRVVTLDKVTDFLFFMSKALITAGVGVGTYYFVLQFPQEYQLHHNWVPTLIVVIGTYLIATVFFSVYSMAVDTLFLCFLEDSERNDGSAEKPYYMSKRLMKILGKKNIIPRHQYR